MVGRRFPKRELGHALTAGAMAAPAVAYMAWLYKADPVFHSRVETATSSPGTSRAVEA